MDSKRRSQKYFVSVTRVTRKWGFKGTWLWDDVLQVRRLLGDTATQVALMMAPLLPRIHTGVGKYGGVDQGGINQFADPKVTVKASFKVSIPVCSLAAFLNDCSMLRTSWLLVGIPEQVVRTLSTSGSGGLVSNLGDFSPKTFEIGSFCRVDFASRRLSKFFSFSISSDFSKILMSPLRQEWSCPVTLYDVVIAADEVLASIGVDVASVGFVVVAGDGVDVTSVGFIDVGGGGKDRHRTASNVGVGVRFIRRLSLNGVWPGPAGKWLNWKSKLLQYLGPIILELIYYMLVFELKKSKFLRVDINYNYYCSFNIIISTWIFLMITWGDNLSSNWTPWGRPPQCRTWGRSVRNWSSRPIRRPLGRLKMAQN